MDKGLIAAYRMTRQRLARKGFANSPARCLEMARADLARAGHSNFTFYPMSDKPGAPGERGGRWIERPESFGLRFVGFSDELRSRGRDSHSGWFLYPDGDPAEVARGCVYQLPARNGRPVYVEALRTGETLGRRTEWRDMSEDGSALLFFGSLHYGDKGATNIAARPIAATRLGTRRAARIAKRKFMRSASATIKRRGKPDRVARTWKRSRKRNGRALASLSANCASI